MFLFSDLMGKQFDYEIQRVFKNKWNDKPITKMQTSFKDKNTGEYVNVLIVVWGEDIDVTAKDWETKAAGDRIIVFGAKKIGFGNVYKGKQSIELTCDKTNFAIVRVNKPTIKIAKTNEEILKANGAVEMKVLPFDVDDALPF